MIRLLIDRASLLSTCSLEFMIQYLQSHHHLFSTDLWRSSRHDGISDVTLWNFHPSFCPFRYSGWRMRKDDCRAQAGNDFLGEWFSVSTISSDMSAILPLFHPMHFFLMPQGACTFPSIQWYSCASTTVGVRKCYAAQKLRSHKFSNSWTWK